MGLSLLLRTFGFCCRRGGATNMAAITTKFSSLALTSNRCSP
jgi:hypothetical protein